MTWGKFVICFFFGFLGVHKFMEKKTGLGLLYLFTLGLFGFGWIIDSGKYLIAAIKETHLNTDQNEELAEQETAYQSSNCPVELPPENPKKTIKHALIWAAALVFALTCFISCSADSGESTDPENTVPPTIMTEVITEPTAEPTAEPTTEPTADATTEPATEPTAEATTEPATEPTTEATTEATTEPATEPTEDTAQDYVANKNSHKFHYPTCSSVDSMKSSNRWDYHGTREELISMGYEPCGRCHP